MITAAATRSNVLFLQAECSLQSPYNSHCHVLVLLTYLSLVVQEIIHALYAEEAVNGVYTAVVKVYWCDRNYAIDMTDQERSTEDAVQVSAYTSAYM